MKSWLLDVGLKTMGPSAIRGAVLGIAGWLLTKNDVLSTFGIVTVGHVTTIDWTKVSIATIAALPAIMAAVIKMVQYHGQQAVQAVTGGTNANPSK